MNTGKHWPIYAIGLKITKQFRIGYTVLHLYCTNIIQLRNQLLIIYKFNSQQLYIALVIN